MQKIVSIIQARMGSRRLPGKILLPLLGKPILLRVVDRVLESQYIDSVVVATTRNPEDDAVAALLSNYHSRVHVSRGSENDVLDRYYHAAKDAHAEIIVRITSDNPLVDPDVVDETVAEFLAHDSLDFVSNNIATHTFPRGLDAEVISFAALEKLWRTATESLDREHVTIHIKRFPENFKWRSVEQKENLSAYRWTVDEEADYRLVKAVYEHLFPGNPHFRMQDILDLYAREPGLAVINAHVEHRNPQY